MRKRKKRRFGGVDARRQRGTAIVEFAVVLPLLLTLLFGIIEYGYVFMVRQTLQHASREGSRLASMQTSAAPYTNVTDTVATIMSSAGVGSYTATVTQGVCQETVTVTVPYSDVSLTGGFFGAQNFNLTGVTTMRKEGCTPP